MSKLFVWLGNTALFGAMYLQVVWSYPAFDPVWTVFVQFLAVTIAASLRAYGFHLYRTKGPAIASPAWPVYGFYFFIMAAGLPAYLCVLKMSLGLGFDDPLANVTLEDHPPAAIATMVTTLGWIWITFEIIGITIYAITTAARALLQKLVRATLRGSATS